MQQKKKKVKLSEAELKKVAMEMGLDSSDWAFIQSEIKDHFTRGERFLKHRNWDDAIEELHEVIALNPYHKDALIQLARAYKGRWDDKGKRSDKERAEKYAKLCLELAPEYESAYQLISKLKTSRSHSEHRHFESYSAPPDAPSILSAENIKRLRPVFAFIGFGLVAVIAVFMFNVQEVEPEPHYMTDEETEEAIETMLETVNNPPAEPQIEVEYLDGGYAETLPLEILTSELSAYDASYSYKAAGRFKPKGMEVSALQIRITGIDENGHRVFTDNEKVVDRYDPIARAGDIIAFDYLEYREEKAPKLVKVEIKVLSVQHNPAPVSYEASPKLPLEWLSQQPSNMDIEVRERLSTYLSNSYSNGTFHEMELEVENKGNRQIEGTELQIEWFDKNDKSVMIETILLRYADVPLQGGETRVYSRTWGVEKVSRDKLKGYKLSVLSIK